MNRRLFGTDGVRGRANHHPITAEIALKIGIAAGQYFKRVGSRLQRVVIGKDTRRSGYMLENALTAGLTSSGMSVLLLGPVPTPAVGFLTHSMRARLGIMISASHNPHFDNGIKFFGPDGYKLSDSVEAEIESSLNQSFPPVSPTKIGLAKRIDDGLGRYVEYAKTTFPRRMRLNGIRVVVDCANGASYRAAPEVLWELGANVIPVCVSPNGTNINHNCGTADTRIGARKVLDCNADIGIFFDGDADRVVFSDEQGNIIGGDQVLAAFAERWSQAGRLAKGTLVATIMSNLGLERHLGESGIDLKRTAVGDRYVVEAMREGGFNLGGEQSGHIVMSDYSTTGDGLIAALQFLSMMAESGKKASELARVFEPVPQLIRNERIRRGSDPLSSSAVADAIRNGERRLNGTGRLIVRKSGTEPLVRVMAEDEDIRLMSEVVDEIVDAIRDVN